LGTDFEIIEAFNRAVGADEITVPEDTLQLEYHGYLLNPESSLYRFAMT